MLTIDCLGCSRTVKNGRRDSGGVEKEREAPRHTLDRERNTVWPWVIGHETKEAVQFSLAQIVEPIESSTSDGSSRQLAGTVPRTPSTYPACVPASCAAFTPRAGNSIAMWDCLPVLGSFLPCRCDGLLPSFPASSTSETNAWAKRGICREAGPVGEMLVHLVQKEKAVHLRPPLLHLVP